MEQASFVDERESEFGAEMSGAKRHPHLAPSPSPLGNKKSRVDELLDESQHGATYGEAYSNLLVDSSASNAVLFPPLADHVLDLGVPTTPMTYGNPAQHLLSGGNFTFQPIENEPLGDGIEQIRYRHAKDASNHFDMPAIDPLAFDQPGRIAPLDTAATGNDQGFADPLQFHRKHGMHSLPVHSQYQHGLPWHPPALNFSSLPFPLPDNTLPSVHSGPGAQSPMLIPQIASLASDRLSLLPTRLSGYQSAPPSRNASPGIPLSLNCDGGELSEYQVLVRQQLEIFEASAEDVSSNTQGRKKQVLLGQAGLRCKHCSRFPLRQRGKGAVYYPTKLQGKSKKCYCLIRTRTASSHVLPFQESIKRLRIWQKAISVNLVNGFPFLSRIGCAP